MALFGHAHLLVTHGIHIIENLNLEELAAAKHPRVRLRRDSAEVPRRDRIADSSARAGGLSARGRGCRGTSGRTTRSPRAGGSCAASRGRAAARRRGACVGVPSGFDASKTSAAAGYTTSRTISASSRIVRSSPVPTLMCSAVVVAAHQEEAGVGEVVHVQELAARRAGAPDRHLAAARRLRVVELADERGQHVRARARSKLSFGP